MNNLKDPIPDNRGRGKVDLSKDHSRFLKRRSKTLITCLLLVFHLVVCLILFFNGAEVLAIVFLAVPIMLFLAFWYLIKAIDR